MGSLSTDTGISAVADLPSSKLLGPEAALGGGLGAPSVGVIGWRMSLFLAKRQQDNWPLHWRALLVRLIEVTREDCVCVRALATPKEHSDGHRDGDHLGGG